MNDERLVEIETELMSDTLIWEAESTITELVAEVRGLKEDNCRLRDLLARAKEGHGHLHGSQFAGCIVCEIDRELGTDSDAAHHGLTGQ